jgi:uncharacterized protein (DUF302 family)
MTMMVEMVNSKQFEKQYNKYYENGGFDKYVDRLIEKFEKAGHKVQYVDVFHKDRVILRKRAENHFTVEFIKAKAWWKFW